MARSKGTAIFAVNFEPTGQAPLDARLVVQSKTDLTNASTYADKNYYKGMAVVVTDESAIYILNDTENITQEASWTKLGAGISSDVSTELNKKVDKTFQLNGHALSGASLDLTLEDLEFDESKYVLASQKNQPNGFVGLGADSKIEATYLPSYVDDVLEYDNLAELQGDETGNAKQTGKIYVTIDNGKTYRWSGSAYVEISASITLGETSSTAYAGDKGKLNREALDSLPDTIIIGAYDSGVNSTGITANDTEVNIKLGGVTKGDNNKYGSEVLSATFTIAAATDGFAGVMSKTDKVNLDQLVAWKPTTDSKVTSLETIVGTGASLPGSASNLTQATQNLLSMINGLSDSQITEIKLGTETIEAADGVVTIPAATDTTDGYMTSELYQEVKDATTAVSAAVKQVKLGSNAAINPSAGVVTIPAVSSSVDGYMLKADKAKLDSIVVANLLTKTTAGSQGVLTGYAKGTSAAIAATDTINAALGKLEAKVDASVSQLEWQTIE